MRLYNIPGTPPQFNAGIVVTSGLTTANGLKTLVYPRQVYQRLMLLDSHLILSKPFLWPVLLVPMMLLMAAVKFMFSHGPSLMGGNGRSFIDLKVFSLGTGSVRVAVDGSLFVASATRDDLQGNQSGVLYLSDRSSGTLAPLGVCIPQNLGLSKNTEPLLMSKEAELLLGLHSTISLDEAWTVGYTSVMSPATGFPPRSVPTFHKI